MSAYGTKSAISIACPPSFAWTTSKSSSVRDELALLDLERLDDLVVRHRLLFLLADLAVADPAAVGLVEQVEVQVVLADRAEHLHRHGHEAEADRPAPDGSRHGESTVESS
jgi:hypothetical protein